MKKQKAINIFEYVDYRFYLRDYYQFQKQNFRYFSYRYFAKRAGVSASLLKDILSGRQNLSIKVMEKYADAMKLKEKEREYFQDLVCFNNAKTNAEKNKYFNDMVGLRGRSVVKFLDEKQYEYFSKWYHSVVREMVTFPEIGNEAEKISRMIKPKVTPAQVKRSIALLKELGLIFKNEKGEWEQSDKVVSSEFEIQNMALRNYQQEMIRLAKESIDRFPGEKRELQAMTLNASEEIFNFIKKRIRTFTDEILSMVTDEEKKAGKVFQLNIQLFPFTESDK